MAEILPTPRTGSWLEVDVSTWTPTPQPRTGSWLYVEVTPPPAVSRGWFAGRPVGQP